MCIFMFISRGTCPWTPPKCLVSNMNYGINYYEVRLQPARPFSLLCLNILFNVLSHETIKLIAYCISCSEGQILHQYKKGTGL